MTTGEWGALILALHGVVTILMVGVIWAVQIVHYPLMAFADRARYPAFQSAHQRRIGWVVIPLMLIEVGTAVALAIAPWSPVPQPLAWAGLVLLAVIWASTFFLQVPLHRRLQGGFDEFTHRLLVKSNWVRAAAWTVRGLLVCVMLYFLL